LKGVFERGFTLYSLRQFERAIADADRIIAAGEKGEAFSAYQLRCLALAKLGRFDEALGSCSKQLRRDPWPGALVDRGRVYLLAGQYDNALADFDAALKKDERDYWAILGRGEALLGNRDYTAALQEFDRANNVAWGASGDPWPIAISKRGLANEALGRQAAAIADFQEALRRSPDLDEAKDGLKRLGASPTAPPEPRSAPQKPWWRFW